MRTSGECPKCNGRDFLQIPRLVDFQNSVIASEHWGSSGEITVVQAIICRGCGFMELYATDPDAIPVDKIRGARRIAPGKGGPYRE